MKVDNIIKIIQTTQPITSISLIEKSYDVLKNNLGNLSFLEKQIVLNKAVDNGVEAAKRRARIEFICACLLFDLATHNPDFESIIKKELNEHVAKLVKAHFITSSHFKDSNQYLLSHSFRTAQLLASTKINVPAICAALLHEIPVHTKTSTKTLAGDFEPETIKLIENFVKIRSIKNVNNSQFASSLREMTMAMAEDLRVVIIKMCSNIDRLKHNLIKDEQKLLNVASESRDILAPLADLLGLWELRWQLEDYSFKILEQPCYEKISKRFHIDEKKNREKYIEKTKYLIQKASKASKINCSIEGRFKHFYSIHKKMVHKKKTFDEICDVFALRIVVSSVDDCYRMLGIIHRLWKPKQRRFKDYIATPKNNNYRSLHTTVFGLNGRPTEFQIRTPEMDEEANFGISAHWYYKNPRKKTPEWIQELLKNQHKYRNDEEFLEKFSSEVLSNQIYVYTPKGDVIALPIGATPVDLAYHVHTEVGHACQTARVNEISVPLNYQLSTNDTVEIILDRENAKPDPKWLEFVKTTQAKKHIELFWDDKPLKT
jgi:GTP diphosphokinase / guanosine-3',5'-bis(diphosphate) 3'-diphosphatase